MSEKSSYVQNFTNNLCLGKKWQMSVKSIHVFVRAWVYKGNCRPNG
jgi:hypothetical protein